MDAADLIAEHFGLDALARGEVPDRDAFCVYLDRAQEWGLEPVPAADSLVRLVWQLVPTPGGHQRSVASMMAGIHHGAAGSHIRGGQWGAAVAELRNTQTPADVRATWEPVVALIYARRDALNVLGLHGGGLPD